MMQAYSNLKYMGKKITQFTSYFKLTSSADSRTIPLFFEQSTINSLVGALTLWFSMLLDGLECKSELITNDTAGFLFILT